MTTSRVGYFSKLANTDIKQALWASVLLLSSLGLAVLSSIARANGLFAPAIVLSLLALLIVAVICFTVVPRLFKRIRLDYWESFRFFRVTGRGAVFLFLVLLIAASTFNTGNNLMVLVLSFLLASLIVSGVISNLVLYGLDVKLDSPDAIHVGQKIVSLLTLSNTKKRFPSFSVTLRGTLDDRDDEELSPLFQDQDFPYLQPREETTFRVENEFRHRGVYPYQGFEVRTKFPFGFFVRGRNVGESGRVNVYPRIRELSGLIHQFPYLMGEESRNRKGFGTGLYNIRDYQSGDDARFVHWKSSAKLARLMMKEFVEETEDLPQLVLSTFLEEPDAFNRNQFEKVLSYVTSLGYLYLERGRTFSFYSGDFKVTVAGKDNGFKSLLDYLALVQPSDRILVERARVDDGAVLFAAGGVPTLPGVLCIDYLKL